MRLPGSTKTCDRPGGSKVAPDHLRAICSTNRRSLPAEGYRSRLRSECSSVGCAGVRAQAGRWRVFRGPVSRTASPRRENTTRRFWGKKLLEGEGAGCWARGGGEKGGGAFFVGRGEKTPSQKKKKKG